MGPIAFVCTVVLAIGAGQITSTLTPGVLGVGPATFAAVMLIVFAIHHLATRIKVRR